MSLRIHRIINYPVSSNCYVLFTNNSRKALIIDPGTAGCEDLLSFIECNSLLPEYIILTHEHFDHIAGVKKLSSIYNTKLIASPKCVDNIADRKKNLSFFFDHPGFDIKTPNLRIDDSWEYLIWQGIEFEFYITPGHSPGSITIITGNYLFAGDLLIKGKKTITKLPGGDNNELGKSLKLISDLSKVKSIIYPGHGDVFILTEDDFKIAING